MDGTPSTAPGPLKLHLGCFDQVVPGWMNTDVTPHIVVSRIPGLAFLLHKIGGMSQERYRQHVQGVFRQVRYLNVGKRFPLSDASVDCVYSQHLLEHLYPEVAKSCLSESFRVLKPGGILRVCIPDLDLMVRGYDSSNPEPFLDAIFEGRQARDKNRHHWHYNKVSMEALLKSVGFPQIFTCGYREGRCPDLASVENRPESLFMEAIK